MTLSNPVSRRRFLQGAGAAWLAGYHKMAAADKGKSKIRDVQTMVFQGERTYTLVKVIADSGLYGIGEAYGSPGAGTKEQIDALKPDLIGKDPLEIDVIYTNFPRRTDGSAHMLMRGVCGIEMALWDLAGKTLGVPAWKLLGGKFRDKVRVYNHEAPKNMLDKASCREWAAKVKADPAGFTGHKFGLQHTKPGNDPGRDLNNRILSTRELLNVRQGFENCREAIGWDHDIMVHCHWEYDVRTSMQLAEAVAPIKPLWFEDPMQPEWSPAWTRLCEASSVPICTGENLFRRHGFKDFIVNQGCDILHPDLRNSGGFLETKRIADMAEVYNLPMATHNTGSQVNTWATIQWGAAIRDYITCETVTGKGGWMDQVLVLDQPYIKGGMIQVPDKPGLGIELNPDVVKAHLAAGEKWWG
ncbi:MAG: mandelate racemase/muconate lactonizing enzyme family protein [Bryobacteraceae bacterium]